MRMKGKYKRYVIYSALLVIFVFVCIILFSRQTYAQIEQDVIGDLESSVERQKAGLDTILLEQIASVNIICDFLGRSDTLISQENLDEIKEIAGNYTPLDRLYIIEPDGQAHMSDGGIYDASDQDYFKRVMAGEELVVEPAVSMVDGLDKMLFSVPIRKDGEIIGVFGGSYNLDYISQMQFTNLYQGKGYAFIVERDGSMVAIDSNYQKEEAGNLFVFYRNLGIKNEEILDEIAESFEQNRSGCVLLEKAGDNRYFVYSPLEKYNWYVCYVVPEDIVWERFQFINAYGGYFILLLLAGLLIFFLLAAHYYISIQKQLQARAEQDPLTGLYNKLETELLIENRLSAAGERTYLLLLLDLDDFKRINDTYGHTAGDQALVSFAGRLRKQFQEEAVIGRVGGDEFAVLIENRESTEKVRARLEQAMREMYWVNRETGELMQLGVSVGGALYPADAVSFKELYRMADVAMYQAKHGGKNRVCFHGEGDK